ncbi:MAG: hypothetical protein IJB79_03185 [Candidatus Gastranaerophilales bacterium]|nr:hypothetical protein [Candidatus Gastranaerophilales bacterium]
MSLKINNVGHQPHAKKPLTKAQKAAAITGAVVATAAVATTIAAGVMGKKVQPDAKLLNKIGAGYKQMGSFIASKASDFGAWVAKKANDVAVAFKKTTTNVASKVGTTADEAQSLAEDLKMI